MSAQALWCEVLREALTDAVFGPASIADGVSTGIGRLATWREDRAFVLQPNRDFDAVCFLAGFDPDAVREAIAERCADHPITDKLRGNRPRTLAPAFAPAPKPKRQPKRFEHDGLSLTAEEWSARTGIAVDTIRHRIRALGWSVSRAVTERPSIKANRSSHARLQRKPKPAPKGSGAGQDFRQSEGTGGGRHAQDRHKLEFSA